ncbi:HEPN domain-containing protein [Pedobacter sp. ok626]|uniref:HEPN domain-containing protein n=1 Tax=Pedobacter sp. ok626 TaxID=1761882 RepID=UPI000891F5F0|nr:HEPN domain-containing protein [Pedobacter sp. ok626]SDK57316.1 HEPN domain-containing protein [Pedobacter sp. ok626]
MKKELQVSEETFYRYLKEKDVSNPHYQIVSFFCDDENSIETLRFGMVDFIKTACSDRYYGDKSSYHYTQQQCVKLLELAYVLYSRNEELKLNPDHFLYRWLEHPFDVYNQVKNKLFPALHFRTLSGTELNDVQTVFEELFSFKDLEAWRAILDSLLYCTGRELKPDDVCDDKIFETVLIREYLEKLIEAMGLVCEAKSVPYVKLHHAGDFRFEIEDEETACVYNPVPLMKFAEKDFPAVINFLADVIAPEKIYCLNHQIGSDGTDHANLILVIPEKYPQTFEEIETAFNFSCLKHHHLSCTIFKSSFFHSMIREGHVYFSMACNAESLVYDDGSKPIPQLRLDSRPEKIEKTNHIFYDGFTKAKTFYTAAEGYQNDNVILSAFLLHQAAELCLRALNRSLTTQDKTTHSLKALLKFSLRLTTKLFMLMDSGSAEDERLLTVFEGAYLGYRYSEKYNIDTQDLNILFDKVKNLHAGAEETFLNWMEKYDLLIKSAQNEQ